MKVGNLKFCILAFASALIISACGNVKSSNENSKSELPGNEPKQEISTPKISEEDFDLALSKVKFVIDEFDGTWEIFNNPKSEEVYLKSSGPRDSRYAINIALYIVRESSDSPLDARASIRFLGTECTNFYQWDTKSEIGVVSFNFENELSDCDNAGIPGVVIEEANRYMTETDMLDYCKVLGGQDVIFRVTGYDGILSQKGSLPNTALKAHKNMCTVHQGLLEGLVPKKS